MLLSGDLGRMGYLGAPVFAVAFALVLTHLPWLKEKPSTTVEATS
jgi:hypothetical protein